MSCPTAITAQLPPFTYSPPGEPRPSLVETASIACIGADKLSNTGQAAPCLPAFTSPDISELYLYFCVSMSLTHSHSLIVFLGIMTAKLTVHSMADAHMHGFQPGATVNSGLTTLYTSFCGNFSFP